MIIITVISISAISLAQSTVTIFIKIEHNDVACIVISLISLGQWTVGHSELTYQCSPRNLPRECAWTGKDDTWSPKVITLKIITGFYTSLHVSHRSYLDQAVLLKCAKVEGWTMNNAVLQSFLKDWVIKTVTVLNTSSEKWIITLFSFRPLSPHKTSNWFSI